MKQSFWKVLFALTLAATISAPAWAANPAQPGTINYVEGQAYLGHQLLNAKSVGTAQLAAGQTISTANGRAEVLLTPGVFLRLDHNSAATLVSPGLTNTEVRVTRGSAAVEVDELHKENHLKVTEADATTALTKKGLYEFNADQGWVQVLKGEARVDVDGKNIKLDDNHALDLDAPKLKKVKLDKKDYQANDFYQWSNLRSEYLSEANTHAAETYASGPQLGTGWYWDPWYSAYTFIPGNGILYSPFGWGYYSPTLFYESPFYGSPFYGYYPYYYGVTPGYRYVGPRPHFGPNYNGRPPILRPHRGPYMPQPRVQPHAPRSYMPQTHTSRPYMPTAPHVMPSAPHGISGFHGGGVHH